MIRPPLVLVLFLSIASTGILPAHAQLPPDRALVRVRLGSEADSAFVVWNEQVENAQLVGNVGTFSHQAGYHKLRLIPARGSTYTRDVSVAGGDTITYGYPAQSITSPLNMDYARLRFDADVLLVLDEDTQVRTGDGLVSEQSVLLRVPRGGTSVIVTDGERERTVPLRSSPRTLYVESASLYPNRRAAHLGIAFPGMYQRAVGRWYGTPLAAATLGAIGWTLFAQAQAAGDRSAFDDAERLYLNTDNERLFDQRYAALLSAHDQATQSLRARNVTLSVVGALAAAHLLDVTLHPYRGRWRSTVDVASLLDPSSPSFGMTTVVRLD